VNPFHGDNTGSNPVGDANRINYLGRVQTMMFRFR
jgi:hypothetical protein